MSLPLLVRLAPRTFMPPPPDAAAVPDVWRLGSGDAPARVAVLGCGGAGCNILRQVAPPPNAERIALNDALHPSMAGIPRRILVRSATLRDFAIMDERAVQKMETNEEKDLSAAIIDRDLVFLLGGLGGDVGGWSMSLAGRVARILGDATLAFATVPFTAEGVVRRQAAEAQLALLRTKADGVVAFANDHLLKIAPDLPLARAFAALAGIIARPVGGLGSVVARADVVPLKRLLARAKDWRFGMGAGTEKHRSFVAVEETYASPWFTGRHEDVRAAVVLMALPKEGASPEEVLHEIHLRSPLADIAWGLLPTPTEGDRVVVQVLAGL